jgi:hypothetical protein
MLFSSQIYSVDIPNPVSDLGTVTSPKSSLALPLLVLCSWSAQVQGPISGSFYLVPVPEPSNPCGQISATGDGPIDLSV